MLFVDRLPYSTLISCLLPFAPGRGSFARARFAALNQFGRD
jgi:hypothetical protein